MDKIPCFYYESASLGQKYQWMHTGPGGSAAVGFGDGLAQLAADFNASDANIGRNLVERRLGTEWQGQAATAATEALNRAATAIAANAAPGNTGRDSSHQYGDSFNATRNAIQLVPDAGANSWWGRQADAAGTALNDTFGSTFGVQSDYSQRLAAYRAADQAANDALYKHETTSRTVLTAYQGAITGQAAAPGSGRAGTGDDQPTHGGPPPGAHGGPAAGTSGAAAAGPAAGVGAAGGPGPGSGTGRTDPTGAGPGGAAGAGRHDAGQGPEAPTTAPAGFTPLGPVSGAPAGLQPGPTGGYVPAGPAAGSVPPPLPPLDGGYGGGPGYGGAGYGSTGYGGTGYGGRVDGASGGGGGYGGSRSPAPRGGTGPLTEGAGRASASGSYGAGGEVGRAAPSTGPAGMPMGGAGAAGGEDREHRNTVFLPDDEPFRVDFDDVTGAVIGLPEEPR
jgi:hypothetical protein